MLKVLLIWLLFSTMASAQDCPALPDASAEKTALYADLAASPDEMAAALIANRLWALWRLAPDSKAQDLLNRGMAMRQVFDLPESTLILSELIAYCPDYPEGYNQRAFTRYLAQDYQGSLDDIEIVLKTEPKHFGALSGKALVQMNMGLSGQAKLTMIEALKVHPWLTERQLLGRGEDL